MPNDIARIIQKGKLLMDDFTKYLNKKLEIPELKKEWDASEPEYNLIAAIIEARKAH